MRKRALVLAFSVLTQIAGCAPQGHEAAGQHKSDRAQKQTGAVPSLVQPDTQQRTGAAIGNAFNQNCADASAVKELQDTVRQQAEAIKALQELTARPAGNAGGNTGLQDRVTRIETMLGSWNGDTGVLHQLKWLQEKVSEHKDRLDGLDSSTTRLESEARRLETAPHSRLASPQDKQF